MSVKSRTGYHPRTFTVKGVGGDSVEIKGYARKAYPHLAITQYEKDARQWRVTHLPTGLAVSPITWKLTRLEAEQFADFLTVESPQGFWESDDVAFYAKTNRDFGNWLQRAFAAHNLHRGIVYSHPGAKPEAVYPAQPPAPALQSDVNPGSLPTPTEADQFIHDHVTVVKVDVPPAPEPKWAQLGWAVPVEDRFIDAGWDLVDPEFSDSYLVCPCGNEIEQDGHCAVCGPSPLRQQGLI